MNQAEIKMIIKRRRDFEYLIRRRQLVPADYYGYLQYEINLDKLRAIRSFRESQDASKDHQDALRSVQSAFSKHICYIFERGIRRFPGNVVFWNDYIAYLKENKSSSILNAVLGRALALYPKDESLWLQAAVSRNILFP